MACSKFPCFTSSVAIFSIHKPTFFSHLIFSNISIASSTFPCFTNTLALKKYPIFDGNISSLIIFSVISTVFLLTTSNNAILPCFANALFTMSKKLNFTKSSSLSSIFSIISLTRVSETFI